MKKVDIIGIGMGNPETLTLGALNIIKSSNRLIGAERMVNSMAKLCENPDLRIAYAIKSSDILKLIKECEDDSKIVVLMSGDTGFYSGSKNLISLIDREENISYQLTAGISSMQYLAAKVGISWDDAKCVSLHGRKNNPVSLIDREENISYQLTAGISSMQYLAAKVGISWDDAKCVSLHGRKNNPVSCVLKYEKVFFLLDKTMTVSKVCKEFTEAGFGELKVYAGENLSYPDEKINVGMASEFAEKSFEPLSVMFVIGNRQRKDEIVTPGISDEEFLRGKVPMTKEEIRALSISKLKLKEDDIVYDLGAGTGSVTIEIAKQTKGGIVYAFEKNEEAVCLIGENVKKFNVKNIKIIPGEASSNMGEIEKPDKAFIGGSGGKLEEMLSSLLRVNPEIRVVINAITLETLAKATEILKEYAFKNIEIMQVNISKNKKLGRYNMLDSQNPIFIISADGDTKEK